MKIIDESHPFYRPLWRRVALVAVLAGWTAFEVFITSLDAGGRGASGLRGLDPAVHLERYVSELSLPS